MFNLSSWFGHKQTPPLPQSVSPPPASPPPPRPSDKPKPSLDGSAAPTLVSPTTEHSLSAHRERRGSVQTRAVSQPPPPPPSRAPPPKDEPEKDAPPRTQWSTPLQTEHDEVLAKLLGEETAPGAAKGKEKEKEKKPVAEADKDKLRSLETVQTGTSGAGGVPSLKVDPVYDPFTGSTMGYAPRPAVPPGGDARDALWDQMAAVRALQSEIAGMHLTMENVGMGSADMGAGRGAAGMGKRRGSAGAGAEKLDELGEDGAEAKDEEKARRERDRLFERAEQTFEGRKEDIDLIMGKLDELSDALTKLHMLDMPQLDLDADFSGPERGNTDSTFGVPLPDESASTASGCVAPSSSTLSWLDVWAAGRPSRMGSEGYVLESPTSMMSTLPDPIDKGPNEG